MPLAALLSDTGYSVTAVDQKPEVVDAVNSGRSPLLCEPGVPEMVAKSHREKRLAATTRLDTAAADVIIFCIPLVGKNAKESFVRKAREILGELPPGRLIVIETTVPLGTCDSLAQALAADGRLKAGRDVWIAHTPERIMTGVALKHMRQFPRIVGGVDKTSAELASALYGKFCKTMQVSSATAAEAVKLFEGVFRDTNIAVTNELAKIAALHKVPINEVIAAANTQPWCALLKPGFGVGGHCIPVYPRFVIESAKELGYHSELLEAARKVNDEMTDFAVSRLEEMLGQKGKGLKGSRIALLGLTYKADTPGLHHAPAERLAAALSTKGAAVVGYDPYVKNNPGYQIELANSKEQALEGADAAIIATPHSAFRSIDLSSRGIAVLDAENMFD